MQVSYEYSTEDVVNTSRRDAAPCSISPLGTRDSQPNLLLAARAGLSHFTHTRTLTHSVTSPNLGYISYLFLINSRLFLVVFRWDVLLWCVLVFYSFLHLELTS